MANLDSLNRLKDDQIKDKTIKIQHFNIKLAWLSINPDPSMIKPQLQHDQY